MRIHPDELEEDQPDYRLIYIAKKLKDALALEKHLTDAGIEYVVEPDHYTGGVIFRSQRIGAFFYIAPEDETRARNSMLGAGFKPWEE